MITKKQFEYAVDEAYTMLLDLAGRKNLTHFGPFKRKLEKEIEFQLEDKEYKKVLNAVNVRSWKSLRCFLTSLILCRHNLPGRPLFRRALKLGALSVLPKRNDIDGLIQETHKLHQAVYEAVDQAVKEEENSNKKFKAPALF